MTASVPIRVLFVDDHTIAREGLRSIITHEQDMDVVGEANSGEAALQLWGDVKPDITIMDLRLPGMSGLDAIQAIRRQHPEAKFIVLTSFVGDEQIHRALLAGVQGYLFKDLVRRELIAAIRAVHQGRRYIPAEVSERLYENTPRVDLTPREVDVLRIVAQGRSNKEIATVLGISEFTVKGYVQSAIGKLNARDRTHAVILALQRGLID
jgi:DNA-binding NarL/FixJ family response regulator